MAAVVDEAAVLELLDGRSRADVGEPAGECRAPTAGLDHEVGAQLVAVLGDHAAHVRRRAVGVAVGEEATDRDAAPHVDAGRRGRDTRDRSFDDRPSTGDRLEALVAVTNAARELGRHLEDRVVPQRAVGVDGVDHVGKLALEDVAEAREEVVEHAELVDAAPLPARPRLVDRGGRRFRVALEHGDRVAVLREQHRGGLARHPTSDNENVRHDVAPFPRFASDDSTDSYDRARVDLPCS